MTDNNNANITGILMEQMKKVLPDDTGDLLLPPPVFTEMNGEIIDFDANVPLLKAQFPVDTRFLNPMGVVQGGVLITLLDNTIGPLSLLIAPPSVTTQFNTSFLQPASQDMAYLTVTARLTERTRRQLFFSGHIESPDGQTLALAQAVHLIMNPGDT
jgi:uncharacterized protein (TIGR00369 family)